LSQRDKTHLVTEPRTALFDYAINEIIGGNFGQK
jgi:hypothetical protein